MAFNATDFRNSFKSSANAVASSAYFEVRLSSMPKCMQNSKLIKRDATSKMLTTLAQMHFRAHQAELPARKVNSESRYYGGEHADVPHGVSYSGILISFLESEQLDIRRFFDQWQELIEGSARGYVNLFYDDVIVPEMVVIPYTKDGIKIGEYKFKNVYPSAVSSSALSWSSVSSFIEIPVEFTFSKWEYKHTYTKS